MAGAKINVMEVGPRDGFQNLKQILPTEKKLEIIDGVIEAGIKEVEIASFVSPKAVPQMADARELAARCVEKHPEVKFWALVPNLRGAQTAWESGIRNVVYIISLSETHNQKNVRRSHEESFADLARLMEACPGLNICVGIPTVFGCPFEGIPEPERAAAFVRRIWDMGIRTVNLADTIGIADPRQVRELVRAVRDALPECDIQIHIHDTRNMGMVNTLAAIECGVVNVQSTLGGLGGCPFAPGASGNTATEDLVFMLNRMGYDTGVDFDKLLAVSKYQRSFVEGIYSGHQMNIGETSLHV